MSQRLGGKDCPHTCLGRDIDIDGDGRIPCEHNGFLGVPLARVIHSGYGRSALKEGYRRDLSPGVDFKRWKAPALKRDGAPYKPSNAATGVPVGSLLTWTEYYGADRERHEQPVRRSGQVWAACRKKAGAVWVAPDDGGSAVALCTKTLDVLR